MLTVDIVAIAQAGPSVLLIQRANEPFAGGWALPGGFVMEYEPVRQAAARELVEETGLCVQELEWLGVYDTPGRDPRGWTVSVVFLARLAEREAVKGADDAREARWFDAQDLPTLAFDHDTIVADALTRASHG